MRALIGIVLLLFSASLVQAEQSKSYWGHQYAGDCKAEREGMMDEAKAAAFNVCRNDGGVNKKKTDYIYVIDIYVIDKGQKLGSGFKQHFCEVKGDIYCNK